VAAKGGQVGLNPNGTKKMKALRRTLLVVLYCLVTCCLIFAVMEVVAGVILDKHLQGSLPIFDCILCDSSNVFRVKADYRGEWPGFNVLVRTNSQGYREDFDFKDKDVDVAFMGDSFTFGWGVNVEDRYSNIAARRYPNLTFENFTDNCGFEPEHYEYFLDRHPELRPKLLFIGLCLGNDLDSDLNETFIERDHHGKIKTLRLPYRGLFRSALINTAEYRYGWLSTFVHWTNVGKLIAIKINSSQKLRHMFHKEAELMPNSPNRLSTELGQLDSVNLRAIRSLKEIANTIEKRNGELHILLIPQNFLLGNVKNPHIADINRDKVDEIRSRNGLMKALINICKTEGLNCHNLMDILTTDDYFEEDAHWKERGHQKVGNYVSKIVGSVFEAARTEHPQKH
jgi:hypothetical protein